MKNLNRLLVVACYLKLESGVMLGSIWWKKAAWVRYELQVNTADFGILTLSQCHIFCCRFCFPNPILLISHQDFLLNTYFCCIELLCCSCFSSYYHFCTACGIMWIVLWKLLMKRFAPVVSLPSQFLVGILKILLDPAVAGLWLLHLLLCHFSQGTVLESTVEARFAPVSSSAQLSTFLLIQ